jgi:hypothetical protein
MSAPPVTSADPVVLPISSLWQANQVSYVSPSLRKKYHSSDLWPLQVRRTVTDHRNSPLCEHVNFLLSVMNHLSRGTPQVGLASDRRPSRRSRCRFFARPWLDCHVGFDQPGVQHLTQPVAFPLDVDGARIARQPIQNR